MNRTQIIALARNRLAYNNALVESYFLAALDTIQQMYETSEGRNPLPWFLLDTTSTVVVSASVRTADAPIGFLAFEEQWVPTLVDGTTEYELVRKMQRDLAPFASNIGRPSYYAFDGLKVHLYALPDKNYSLKFPCYKRSTAFSAAETSLWYEHFPNLIVEELIAYIASNSRDMDALKLSRLSREQDSYRVRCEAMKHQLMEYIMGGPDPIGVNDGT